MKSYTLKMTVVTAIALILCSLILLFPKITSDGVIDGLILCSQVIIPSLFPFCALALFCQKSNVISFLSKLFSPVSRKIFHQSGEQFCVFLMSFLAGYPVGVRLIRELYEQKKLSLHRARLMSLYCVNAGPAFILTAVGQGILNDRILGVILLLANTIATLILAFVTEFREEPDVDNIKPKNIPLGDAFVCSTAEAAGSIFGICAWVVLFSAFLAVINCGIFPAFLCKALSVTAEVTTAAANAGGNILIISSILSFCWLSVHCQVYSVGKEIMPSYLIFLGFRSLHAIISTAITYILVKLDHRTVTTISNGILVHRANTSFSYAGAASLILMSVCLIISISGNKKCKIL